MVEYRYTHEKKRSTLLQLQSLKYPYQLKYRNVRVHHYKNNSVVVIVVKYRYMRVWIDFIGFQQELAGI